MREEFDLIVLGGGSGGLAAAQRAAAHGARVAVVEGGRLGGTCVNVGCVPKKVMWHAAEIAATLHDAADYGFDVRIEGHDWAGLKARRDAYIARLNGIYAGNLAGKGIVHVAGWGRFAGPHDITAGDRHLSAGQIIIATGCRPSRPDIPGAVHGIDSDGFFALEALPRRVGVVGSGYIAVELAGVLRALGAEVSLVVRTGHLLRRFDDMLREALAEAMEADGITLVREAVPVAAGRDGTGHWLATADGRRIGPYDTLLWATGREPLTGDLGLDKAGVHCDAGGYIPTDALQTTNIAHISAIGDVTGRAALTPVAIAAGRRLADRLWGGMPGRHLDYTGIPTVVFSHPPIGTCGLSEAEARAAHGDAVRVYHSAFVSLYHGVRQQKPKTRMKLVTLGAEEKVIGCHLIGAGADEILQGFAVAMRMGATKRDLDDTIAIHPTAAEELVTMR